MNKDVLGLIIMAAIFAGVFFHAHNQVKRERRHNIRYWARTFKHYVRSEREDVGQMLAFMDKFIGDRKGDFYDMAREWSREIKAFITNKCINEEQRQKALKLAQSMEWYADQI